MESKKSGKTGYNQNHSETFCFLILMSTKKSFFVLFCLNVVPDYCSSISVVTSVKVIKISLVHQFL